MFYFLGCRTLLQFPDLQSNGSRQTSISSDDYNCSLHGHYFDYNGFQSKWQTMIDGIFSLKKQGGQGVHGGQLQGANKKFSIVVSTCICCSLK